MAHIISMSSAAVINDIRRNLEKQNIATVSVVAKLLTDLCSYQYNKKRVMRPSAYGDSYKYTVNFVVGKYHFSYEHVLPDGDDVEYARLDIYKSLERSQRVIDHSYMARMFHQMQKKDYNPYNESPVFNDFIAEYSPSKEWIPYVLFALTYFMSFTIGHVCGLMLDDDKIAMIETHIDDLLSYRAEV